MTRSEAIDRLKRERPVLRERFGVAELALFGSFARGDDRPDSDVDVLVGFDRPITLFDLVALNLHLEDCFNGRKVDVVPRDSVLPAFSKTIFAEAVDVR
jgi:predicted nucleotidyltransferase